MELRLTYAYVTLKWHLNHSTTLQDIRRKRRVLLCTASCPGCTPGFARRDPRANSRFGYIGCTYYSLVEVRAGKLHHVVWDLNFGEGTESRQVFLLDGGRELGRNLAQHRYGLLWDKAVPVFRYTNGDVEIDALGEHNPADLAGRKSQLK